MKLALNYRLILVILSLVAIVLGGTMFVGLVCSIIYKEQEMARIFFSLMAVFAIGGYFGIRVFKRGLKIQSVKIRDGILSVTLCWVFAAALGAVPYLLAGSHSSFIDAFFEAMACITTTGSTLVDNLTELPMSLLFWRQLTTWIGGIGIVIFAATIIPMLGFGAANLVGAETPVLTADNIRARVSDTARAVVLLFLVFTAIEIVLLCAGGTGIFNAFVLSFSCMGNGGFAAYQPGLAFAGNLYIEAVIGVFCVIASMSFVSYKLLLKRRIRDFFKEIEIRLYLIMLGIVCALTVIILAAFGTYEGIGEAARHGIFQTISFATTAGYSSTNFGSWPKAVYWLLILVMIIGGCSGSASGGIKVARAAVAVATIRRSFYKRLHPNAVVAVKLGDRTVSADRVSSIASFMMIYSVTVVVSCFVLSFENMDAETTLGTVVAMLSNTGLVMGPGNALGESFAGFSQFSRLYASILMVAGRLEMLTVILLFTPAFWRPYR